MRTLLNQIVFFVLCFTALFFSIRSILIDTGHYKETNGPQKQVGMCYYHDRSNEFEKKITILKVLEIGKTLYKVDVFYPGIGWENKIIDRPFSVKSIRHVDSDYVNSIECPK